MRPIDADALMETFEMRVVLAWVKNIVNNAPTIDAVPIVRCQECAHAPVVDGQCEDGFDIKFPDEICPCQCTGDGWYNYIPDPNWFCADGERKDGADNG